MHTYDPVDPFDPSTYRPRIPSRVPAGSDCDRDEDGPDIRQLPDQNSPEEWDGLGEQSKQARENARQAAAYLARRFKQRQEEQDQALGENATERAEFYNTAFNRGTDRHGRPLQQD